MPRWTALFMLLLLLAGCSRGAVKELPPPPVTEAPPPATEAPATPGTPAPEPLEGPRVTRINLYRGSHANHPAQEGLTVFDHPIGRAEAVVGSGEVLVSYYLDQGETASLKERVRSNGHAFDLINPVGGLIQVHFPAGGPDRWEVWLDGIPGSNLVLVRQPEPRVRIGYRHGGGDLVMLDGGELSLPPGPLTLEFHFDQPVDYKSFDIWRAQVYDRNRVSLAGSNFAWPEPDRLVWELERVPSKLELELSRLQAASTLLPVVPRSLIVRNTESAPYLERVNLANGQRERLMEAIPETMEAKLSPDRRYVAVRAWAKRADQEGSWSLGRVVLLDLTTRQVLPTPLSAFEMHWAGGRLLTLGLGIWGEQPGWSAWDPARGGEPVTHPERIWWATVSPDGQQLAFLDVEPLRRHADLFTPVWLPLVIQDLKTGERRLVPEFVRGWWSGKGGDGSLWVAWSPDSRRVVAIDPVNRSGPSDLVAYDLAKGERAVLRSAVRIYPQGTRLQVSPDGAHLLGSSEGQPAWLLPLTGEGEPVRLGEYGSIPAFWDERGERILAMEGEWGKLFVYSLKSGGRLALGEGWPVGWDGDSVYVIRWAGSDGRYVPEYP